MGLINNHKSCPVTESHHSLHKFFTICNYILLCAASSCIFLTLSLRLFPSLCGFFIILLHMVTIIAAVSGCSASLSGSNKWYAAHMVSTSLAAIFQGSVSVLIFTQTGDFLGYLKVLCKRRRWRCNPEVSWWALFADFLPRVGGFGSCFLAEVLCFC
ncbi:hypothetical protein OIU78_026924 [Salix suchowensis]|nr:hypothetical protein OIU78_026924 [Salix suchowensis]